MKPRSRGFTLVEVLVALVIVAFGMGAVLASLNSAASNIGALREKSLAQWVALNLVADARLSLQAPTQGTSTGEVDNFGGGNWQWSQSVTPLAAVPGMLQIVVQVRRSTEHPYATSSSSSGVTTQRSLINSGSTLNRGPSLMSSSGANLMSSSSGGFLLHSSSSSSGAASGSSSGALLGISSGSAGKDQNWTATVIGFRGDAVANANGENNPNWDGTSVSSSSSSSGGGSVMPNFTLGGSSGGTTSAPVTQQGRSADAT